jgi:hypothetical protein
MEYENETVFVQPHTKKFHKSRACAGTNPIETNFSEAIRAQRSPCSVCLRDELFNYCIDLME